MKLQQIISVTFLAGCTALLGCGDTRGNGIDPDLNPQCEGDDCGAGGSGGVGGEDGSGGEGGTGGGEGGTGGTGVDDGICKDFDQDGFYTCVDPDHPERSTEIDCNDGLYSVQPGGYDFPDNGIDDNCNGEVDETQDCACDTSSDAGEALLKAIGICGNFGQTVELFGDDDQFEVMTQYWNSVPPREGSCMAAMSTGVTHSDSITYGDSVGSSSCIYDDPDPTGPAGDVCDLAQIRVTLTPPPNALGFMYNFMFMSSEWPEFLCQSYNDTYYSIYTSPLATGGVPTNTAFDPQNQDITVNVGFFEDPAEWTTPLGSTPYGASKSASCSSYGSAPGCSVPDYCDTSNDLDHEGSGSGWLQSRAPIGRGPQSIDLVFSIHDEGDDALDSMVLLNKFRWLPFAPPLGTAKPGSVVIP